MLELTAMLAASAAKVLSHEVMPALKEWLRMSPSRALTLKVGDQNVTFATDEEGISQIKNLLAAQLALENASKDTSGPIARANRKEDQQILAISERSPQVAGVALALDADSVFRDARKRVDFVFRINLAVSIVLAILLLGGIAGAIVAGFVGDTQWAAVFGGISATDVLGAIVYKPLKAVNRAITYTQRLDMLHLSAREELAACHEYEDLSQRIKCTTRLWAEIRKELSALSESDP